MENKQPLATSGEQHEVGFPMARRPAAFDLGGAFGDRAPLFDEAGGAASWPRAAGRDDEVAIGGRNLQWSYRLTDEEILGPLPEPPSFPEDFALVRDRIRKLIGKIGVSRAPTAQHPAIARLIEPDDVRRQKRLTASYTFSWDKPVSKVRLNMA